jgi:hypothetical protein
MKILIDCAIIARRYMRLFMEDSAFSMNTLLFIFDSLLKNTPPKQWCSSRRPDLALRRCSLILELPTHHDYTQTWCWMSKLKHSSGKYMLLSVENRLAMHCVTRNPLRILEKNTSYNEMIWLKERETRYHASHTT